MGYARIGNVAILTARNAHAATPPRDRCVREVVVEELAPLHDEQRQVFRGAVGLLREAAAHESRRRQRTSVVAGSRRVHS